MNLAVAISWLSSRGSTVDLKKQKCPALERVDDNRFPLSSSRSVNKGAVAGVCLSEKFNARSINRSREPLKVANRKESALLFD